jgi:acyl carrier protein
MIATENQSRIAEILAEIIQTKGLPPIAMDADTVLEQIGLESLDFAQVVIRMEELTGKDPFASATEYQIKTLSDLAAVYDQETA